ncbi:uncharacterized protein LOC117116157 [Anneissia japonica]|uniref:uncharacterized protein LOC117116157 n=1 Tax=Anneissia japonica TaxID=1529436 RepID=UPI001425AA7D|nr:uncharacterized protein LOC117116157 [Anneissia japonica]XP_033116044.1 uncharacterized protein LOC117116157 [Anneissia japonica]
MANHSNHHGDRNVAGSDSVEDATLRHNGERFSHEEQERKRLIERDDRRRSVRSATPTRSIASPSGSTGSRARTPNTASPIPRFYSNPQIHPAMWAGGSAVAPGWPHGMQILTRQQAARFSNAQHYGNSQPIVGLVLVLVRMNRVFVFLYLDYYW